MTPATGVERKDALAGEDATQPRRPNYAERLVVLVDYCDADVLERVHLVENLVNAVEAAGARDHRLGRNFFRDNHLQHRRIVRRLHSERADQLEFHQHDSIYRHRNFALLGRSREPDLQVTTLLAQTHDRITAGGGDSERIDGHVRAAAREIENRADRIRLLCIDYVRRAHALGELEAGRLNVDADDVGSHGCRDVDRRETDAA